MLSRVSHTYTPETYSTAFKSIPLFSQHYQVEDYRASGSLDAIPKCAFSKKDFDTMLVTKLNTVVNNDHPRVTRSSSDGRPRRFLQRDSKEPQYPAWAMTCKPNRSTESEHIIVYNRERE